MFKFSPEVNYLILHPKHFWLKLVNHIKITYNFKIGKLVLTFPTVHHKKSQDLQVNLGPCSKLMIISNSFIGSTIVKSIETQTIILTYGLNPLTCKVLFNSTSRCSPNHFNGFQFFLRYCLWHFIFSLLKSKYTYLLSH